MEKSDILAVTVIVYKDTILKYSCKNDRLGTRNNTNVKRYKIHWPYGTPTKYYLLCSFISIFNSIETETRQLYDMILENPNIEVSIE